MTTLGVLPDFAMEAGCLERWLQIKVAGAGRFRKQHLIGNLAWLQLHHPKDVLMDYVPKGLFAFVTTPDSGAMGVHGMDLEVLGPLISDRNTTLVAEDLLTQCSIRK